MNTTDELHVIFGTGPLAKSVMRELLVRNKRVRMVNRSGKADVPSNVEIIASDAYNPDNTRLVTTGATVVYQCAQPGYTQWPEFFPSLQASIVEGAAANGAKLVVGDNLYMYGPVNGVLREDLPNAATTRKGRVRGQMTEALLDAHRRGIVRVAIGRASDFYGPEVLGSAMGDRVFSPILTGKPASAVGEIDLPHTYTFIDDFGKALVVLGEHDNALGQIWHIPNAETITTRQFITIAFEEAGHPPKISKMGKFMMRLGGIFIPEAREAVEMMYEFDEPFVVNHDKYVQAFGNHATPLREAIRRTLAWYSKHLKTLTLKP
ncbi:NAD-dependent dehydratase [Nostocaceae cyanobacterium CENA357]|uniref:NAD-dependent dehydratase n=1 Tax=Atlanticothrix silvestris CENA357 TaxID=1725252 RepID=A0A8J7L5L7_9CYAN|nr:SDR family oxidoreductase [Atlanticothrix silvestris]MBH8553207.1 NAD-dependent dehydratase [Atlanticothrix silvestris CENA357]